MVAATMQDGIQTSKATSENNQVPIKDTSVTYLLGSASHYNFSSNNL